MDKGTIRFISKKNVGKSYLLAFSYEILLKDELIVFQYLNHENEWIYFNPIHFDGKDWV